jgi:hypothetical protein
MHLGSEGIEMSESRGVVVSPPITIEGQALFVRSGNLDPQELRCWLLFWDKLAWPFSRAIYMRSGPDEQFLEEAGVLIRSEYTVTGDVAQGVAIGQIRAFEDLDSREPGRWSLAQGDNSLLLKDGALKQGSGMAFELIRAVPVPNRDVPLNEILEFKLRRHDELQLLRTEIDSLLPAIEASDDENAELMRCIQRIDAASADALRVAHEWRFPVRLSNLKASIELRPSVTAAAGLAAWSAAAGYGLPASQMVLTTAVAAAASALKISADFGWRGLRPRSGPYRYVSLFHNELF